MSLEDPAPDEVVALRYDEVAAVDDLATWCHGRVEQLASFDGVERPPVLWVPTRREPKAAMLGDWVVREPDGSYQAYSPEGFAARFEPAEQG